MATIKPKNRADTIIAALAVVAVVVFQAWFMFDNARGMADDAMISARFARNWASGAGLTYNRDGTQPVEGYSNFIWVAAIAAGFRVGVHPRLTTAYLGGTCAIAAALIAGLWVWRITRRKLAAVATTTAVGLSLPFGLWAVQGLETPLIALLFVAVAASIDEDRPRPWPWAFALLAALTRPDGFLAAAALAVVEARRPKEQRRAAALSALWFVLPFAAYTLWRWSHFDALLPNTFGAKTGLGMAGVKVGAKYIGGYYGNVIFPFGYLICGYFFMTLQKKINISAKFSMHLISAYLLFILLVGGDFMPDHRFLMHLKTLITAFAIMIWPFLYLVPLLKDEGKWWQWLVKWYPAILLVSTLISSGTIYMGFNREPQAFNRRWHRDQAEWYGPTASWLVRNTQRTDVIAAGDIGYIGYVTDNDRILDFNGLVDRHLASLPGAAAFRTDADYVFDQRPEYLVLMVHRFEDGRELGHTAFDRAARTSPRLSRDYELVAELPGWSQMVPAGTGEPPTLFTDIFFRIYRRSPGR